MDLRSCFVCYLEVKITPTDAIIPILLYMEMIAYRSISFITNPSTVVDI